MVRQNPTTHGLVLVAVEHGIAQITLNRPDRLNALDHALALDLADTFDRLAQDATVRVITLMGAGRAFMAGGDVSMFRAAGKNAPEVIGTLIGLFHRTIRCIREMDAIVVAGVQGAVAGGGVGLALACDFVVAAEDASFVPAYLRLGTNPDGGHYVERDATPRAAPRTRMAHARRHDGCAFGRALGFGESRCTEGCAHRGGRFAGAPHRERPQRCPRDTQTPGRSSAVHGARRATRSRVRRLREGSRHTGFPRRCHGISRTARAAVRTGMTAPCREAE